MRSREVYRYVEKRQRQLYLDEWGLQVHTVQAQELDDGNCARVYGYQPNVPGARIDIACKHPDEEVKNSCTHEVCHVRLADMHFVFERALSRLGDAEAQALREAYAQAEERAVVAFTDALEAQEE